MTKIEKSVQLYSDNILQEFYEALKSKTFKYLHVPHSDVFYVRAALENKTGIRYRLAHIEQSMLRSGWKDG